MARLLGLQPGVASGGFLRIFRVLLGSGDHDLRRQIQFLKAENEVLRAKIAGPVRVTPQEKSRLVRLTPVQLPHCSPNLNAHVERFIQTLRRECLDKFIVLGTDHLDHLVDEFVVHYNTERPHSSLDSQTPAETRPPRRRRLNQQASRLTRAGPKHPTPPPTPLATIRCRTRLGGTLRHYYRAA